MTCYKTLYMYGSSSCLWALPPPGQGGGRRWRPNPGRRLCYVICCTCSYVMSVCYKYIYIYIYICCSCICLYVLIAVINIHGNQTRGEGDTACPSHAVTIQVLWQEPPGRELWELPFVPGRFAPRNQGSAGIELPDFQLLPV